MINIMYLYECFLIIFKNEGQKRDSFFSPKTTIYNILKPQATVEKEEKANRNCYEQFCKSNFLMLPIAATFQVDKNILN